MNKSSRSLLLNELISNSVVVVVVVGLLTGVLLSNDVENCC